MAVRAQKYAQELEKQLAAKKSLGKAHSIAAKKHTVKRTPKKKSNWVSRLKRNIDMILKGPKYYSSLQKSKRSNKTTRTKAIERGLGASLTKKEIAKLRGKK